MSSENTKQQLTMNSDTTEIKSIKKMLAKTETTNELDLGNLPDSLKLDFGKLQTLVYTLLVLFVQFELFYKSNTNHAFLWLARFLNDEMWRLYSKDESKHWYGMAFMIPKDLADPPHELKLKVVETIIVAIHMLKKEGNKHYTIHLTLEEILEACKKRKCVNEGAIGKSEVTTHHDPELQANIKKALKKLGVDEKEEKEQGPAAKKRKP